VISGKPYLAGASCRPSAFLVADVHHAVADKLERSLSFYVLEFQDSAREFVSFCCIAGASIADAAASWRPRAASLWCEACITDAV